MSKEYKFNSLNTTANSEIADYLSNKVIRAYDSYQAKRYAAYELTEKKLGFVAQRDNVKHVIDNFDAVEV